MSDPAFARFMIRQKNTPGFTLIELIASLFLVALLTAIFSMGLVAAIQGYDYNRTNVEVALKARMAMARMSRELQEMVAILRIADNDQDPFIIYDRVVEANGRPEQHTFGLHFSPADACIRLYTNLDERSGGAPSVLSNGTIADGDILIDQVQSLSLQFFREHAPWTEGMDATLLSTIEIILNITRADAPGKTETFRTLIHLRNTNNEGGASL